MPHLADEFPGLAAAGNPFDHHQDLADLDRLLVFVRARRTALAAAGRPTAEADALLKKLRLAAAGVRACLGARAG